MARLPHTASRSERARNRSPVGSKERKGSVFLTDGRQQAASIQRDTP